MRLGLADPHLAVPSQGLMAKSVPIQGCCERLSTALSSGRGAGVRSNDLTDEPVDDPTSDLWCSLLRSLRCSGAGTEVKLTRPADSNARFKYRFAPGNL